MPMKLNLQERFLACRGRSTVHLLYLTPRHSTGYLDGKISTIGMQCASKHNMYHSISYFLPKNEKGNENV